MDSKTQDARRRTEDAPLFSDDQRKSLAAWTTRYPHAQMGLIEAMRLVQEWQRRISFEAETYLAELFRVPIKVVHEVATFYPYFTTKKACGTYRVAVCHNLTCTLAGAKDVLHGLERTLGVEEGGTTKDGRFSLEAVECLGVCDKAPAVAVNDELVETDPVSGLDTARLAAVPATPAPAFVWKPQNGQDSRLITRHFDDPTLHELATYKKYGGYAGLEKALTLTPAQVTEEVKKSNLRGLGGAGFPVGVKWSTVPPKDKVPRPHYVVANADESEPGCFKDRVLMERSPHAVLEGALIAGHAMDADAIFIFIRGEYARQHRILSKAIAEARAAGYLGKADILLMRGAGAYISGADTALMETMEGKKAWPRQPPPFPTANGVMGNPTAVNNVETLAMVPYVFTLGADAFAKLGTPKSGGTVLFSVSGHVQQPGVYEFPMGTPLRAVLDAAGGIRAGRTLKAVIPGGTSTPVLAAAELDVKMDFEGLRAAGSFLGAGGLIALDDSADMVEVLHIIERFLWHESCGQCTPCREGSEWLTRILARVLDGRGVATDPANIRRVSENITGKVICALGDTVGMVAQAMLNKFPGDFEARLKTGTGKIDGR